MYDHHPETCYRTEYKTEYKDQQYTVCKPICETSYRQETYNTYHTVTETKYRECQYTVQKPVWTTEHARVPQARLCTTSSRPCSKNALAPWSTA